MKGDLESGDESGMTCCNGDVECGVNSSVVTEDVDNRGKGLRSGIGG